MHYIEKIFTENTGGGSHVDFVILKDGRCIGINDECLVVYPSYGTFYASQYVTGAIIFDNEYPQINFKGNP